MRPGLRESIEPSGADGGNVGADAGGRTRSSALNWPNSLEFVCLETLCAPKRTDSMYSGHASGWDRPPVDPLNAHSPWWRVRGHAITTPGAQQAKSPNSEFVYDEGRDWLAGIALWKAVEVWNLEEGSPLQGSTPNTLGRRSRGRQWRSTSGTNWTASLSAG